MFQASLVNQIIHAAIADSFLVFLLLPISPVIGDFSKIALKYPNDITTDRASEGRRPNGARYPVMSVPICHPKTSRREHTVD